MDITKSIIRIVQDYCFKNSAPLLSSEFAIYIANSLSAAIERKELTVGLFTKTASKRKDFFLANNLDVKRFSKGQFAALNYELSFLNDVFFCVTQGIQEENGEWSP